MRVSRRLLADVVHQKANLDFKERSGRSLARPLLRGETSEV